MDEPAVTPPKPRRSLPARIVRGVAWTLAGLVVLVVVVAAIGWWVIGRETTLQRIVTKGEEALHGQLEVQGVTGSIYDHVGFERLVFRSKTQIVTVERGTVRYRVEPFERRFTILDARAAKLTIETIAKSDEPTTDPDTLELPADLRLDTLRLDAVHLDAMEFVNGTQKTTLGAADLKARYATEGLATKRWTIERIAVKTPWGDASGAGAIDAAKPFQLEAKLLVDGKIDDVPYHAPLDVKGVLAQLDATSDFTVSDPTNAQVPGHADARVLPFREQPIERAQLHVAGIAPKRWKADLPEAEITVDADLKPLAARLPSGGDDPFTGSLRVVNAVPGPIDHGRIPVAKLDADVTGDSAVLSLARIAADLGRAGQVVGRGSYAFANGGVPSFEGAVRSLDLRAIHGRLIASRFDGPLAISRKDGIVKIDTALTDQGRSVRVKGEFEGHEIRIAEGAVQLGGTRATVSGRLDLERDRPFDLTGELVHANPRDFGDFARADVNAAFHVKGTIGPEASGRTPQAFRVASDIRLDPSRIAERSISGTIAGTVDGAIEADPPKGKPPVTIRQIAGARVALALGADRLTLDGDFGRPQDRLHWTVDAPRLADLGVGATGALKGDGFVGGTLAEPAIDFTVEGDDLTYAKGAATTVAPTQVVAPDATTKNVAAAGTAKTATTYGLKSLRGTGRLLAGSAGRLDADVTIAGFRDGSGTGRTNQPTVQAAHLKVEGTRESHHLALSATSDRFDFTTTADGGLDASNTWRGTVTQLESRGRVPFALAGTTTLTAGPGRVEIGAAQLKFNEGQVDLERLTYIDDRLATAGRASGFPMSLAGTFSKTFSQRVATTLKFGGQWDLRVGDTIDGKVRIFRESGNIRFLTEPRIDVDPEKLEVDADIVADRVTAKVSAIGKGLGRIEGSVDTRFSKRDGRWGLAGDAPLALKSDVDIPDLRWLARLSGIPGLDVYGALKVAVTGSGTVGEPSLSGHANGEALGIRWPDQGVNARDGKIDLDFVGDRVVIKQATMSAGDGHLDATGDLRLADRKAAGTLKLKFDKFEAVSRTDRTMVVSGTGTMKFGATGVDITADVKADRGSLQLAERRGPTLSNDIVIVGRETDEDEAVAPSTPVRFEVKFNMGDDFKVKGAGFDGKLGGNIRIAGTGTDLKAIGAVQVREGTYEGYGQHLTIDRGNLVFSGPIDNPALDIVAIRKNLAVEAGVQISGTALSPQAKLTSTPNVPDTEKLSWLVLGHGLSASNKSDYALLTSVAAGLLGSSDSTSIQSRVAATLGVDEVGVSGLGGTTGGLVTIGKQISSKLRVTLEQGFTKAATLVKLRYNVYKHIDVQVQTGTESAIDVFYTFTFD